MTTTPTWDPFDRIHPANPPGGTSSATAEHAAAVVPTPVFVDHSGRRGRRLRGLGWLVGSVSVGFAVAMTAGLIGTQSQAPSVRVPANVNTTPPGQYLDAPLPTSPPSPKGKRTHSGKGAGAKTRSTATASATGTARSTATGTARATAHH